MADSITFLSNKPFEVAVGEMKREGNRIKGRLLLDAEKSDKLARMLAASGRVFEVVYKAKTYVLRPIMHGERLFSTAAPDPTLG
jgi:hypothetical protein